MATGPGIINSTAHVAGRAGPSLVEVAASALFRVGEKFHERFWTRGRVPPEGEQTIRCIGRPAFPNPFILLSVIVVAAIFLALVTAISAFILTDMERRELAAPNGSAAAKLTAHAQVMSLAGERAAIAQMMEPPPASAIFHSLAQRLPADSRIASVERDSQGMVSLEIALNDPDVLDTAFEADAILGRLVQSRQWSDGSGRLRVTLRGRQK